MASLIKHLGKTAKKRDYSQLRSVVRPPPVAGTPFVFVRDRPTLSILCPVMREVEKREVFHKEFRYFLALPKEIRRMVYHYLIPHGTTIEFGPAVNPRPAGRSIWYTRTPRHLSTLTSLFLVNQGVSSEALQILYAENTLRFHITRQVRTGSKPRSDRGSDWVNTFTVCAVSAPRMTRCEIVIKDYVANCQVFQRVRRCLEGIVESFGPKHALQKLSVELLSGSFKIYGPYGYYGDNYAPSPKVEFVHWSPYGLENSSYQYALEPLADLSRIPYVEISGDVTDEFSSQLKAVMMSKEKGKKPEPVKEQELKKVYVKKRGRVRKKPKMAKARFYDPELSWNELGKKTSKPDSSATDGDNL